jgi:hypothetical protein
MASSYDALLSVYFKLVQYCIEVNLQMGIQYSKKKYASLKGIFYLCTENSLSGDKNLLECVRTGNVIHKNNIGDRRSVPARRPAQEEGRQLCFVLCSICCEQRIVYQRTKT